MTRLTSWCIAALLLSACLDPVTDISVGRVDGGAAQADAGPGAVDAGQLDGGSTSMDAGRPTDDGGTVFTPLTCAGGEWCWQTPLPLGQGINAVFTVSDTEAWAVGEAGATLRFQSGAWEAMRPVTTADLKQIVGSGPRDLWVLAEHPVAYPGFSTFELLHFNGAQWQVVPFGPLPRLVDVRTASSGETWVLTADNTGANLNQLLRWNGNAFVPVPALPNTLQPSSVCVRSANEVWVTAGSEGTFPSELYRYSNGAWALVAQVTTPERFDSRVTCPADGVAVVTAFDFDLQRHQFMTAENGSVTRGTAPAYVQLLVTPHNEVFSVDRGRASRWTPSGWVSAFTLPNNVSVYSVQLDFVGASGWFADTTARLSKWDGAAFAPQGPLEDHLSLFVSPRDTTPRDPIAAFGTQRWAVREATGWRFQDTPLLPSSPTRFTPVFAASEPSGDAWLVGNGIYRFTAATGALTPAFTSSTELFNAVDSAGGAAWAVGNNGVVRRFNNGQWELPPVALPALVDTVSVSGITLSGVHVRSDTDVMLLGTDPAGGRFLSAFFHWNGTAWSTTAHYGNTISLFGRDPAGTLYFVDGSELKKRPVGGTIATLAAVPESPRRLKVYGADELELVTQTARTMTFRRYDTDRQAFSIKGAPLGFSGASDVVLGTPTGTGQETFWALGQWGAVLRFVP